MANPIKYTELVDKSDVEAGFDSLINLYKKLEKDAKKAITGIKEATKGIIPTSKGAAEAVGRQSKEFRTQKRVVDESQKAIKTLAAAQQKLKTAQSNVGIETAKVRDAISRQNRLTKQAITLSRANKSSMTALNIELGKNRQRYRELSAAQRANANVGGKLLTTIKQQDANLKKLDASIGNNQRSVGNYGIALQGATRLLGALGLAGGIALVVRGLKEMIGVFAGFEKQMAKVRAVSGATDEEFALLTADAKRLGESTEKTASAVAGLQLQYAKLGFTTPQIIAATEATLDLATATDEDLAQSALVAAKTIKGFNLSAEETVRVTDVMALSFSMSALNLSAFQDAMKTVAPVALAVNSSLESTTAVLSTLVDAGLDASTAGTSLRNIFIELETQGLSWEEAMEKVRNSTHKVRTATELFGKRASTAALIIANNTEKIDSLTVSYENAEGSAKAMADIMRDTLIGDVDRAKSAVQGMFIQIGEKLTPALRVVTKGFTFFITNIKAFFKIIGIAGAGLVAYTVITKGAAIAKRGYTIAVNIAKIATKAFNLSVKASPIGLLVGLLAAVVAAYFAFKDSIKDASEAQDKFNERHKVFLDELAKEEAQLKTLFSVVKTAKEGTEERAFAINEINKLYGDYLPNLLTEKSTLEEIEAAQTIANKALIQNIAIKSKQNELSEIAAKRITIERNALQGFSGVLQVAIRGLQDMNKFSGNLNDRIRELAKIHNVSAAKISIAYRKMSDGAFDFSTITEEINIFYNQFIESLGLATIETEKNTNTTDKNTESKEKNITRLQFLNDQLKKERLAIEKIADENTKETELAILLGKAKIGIIQDNITAIEKVLELKKEEDDLGDEERKKAREKAEEEFAFQEDILSGAKSLVEQENVLFDKRLKQAGIFGVDRENLTAHQLDVLEILEQEHQDNIDKIKEDAAKKEEERRKKELEDIKELADIAVNGIIEGLNRRADAAIKTANTEIQATEKQISQQEALAAQGLDNSLKFEQEQRAKALLAKLEAEKAKQTAEKISAFWNLVSNSDNVLEAIAKFGIGEAFARTIEALPGFEEGGLTPEKESIVRVSEKGREFVAHHEATEKYLPQLKAMNEGTYDNQLVNYIDNSRFIPQNLPTNDIQVQQLISEMKAMRNEFKNSMPKVESYFDASTKEIINIVKYQNRKKITHYKVPRL